MRRAIRDVVRRRSFLFSSTDDDDDDDRNDNNNNDGDGWWCLMISLAVGFQQLFPPPSYSLPRHHHLSVPLLRTTTPCRANI